VLSDVVSDVLADVVADLRSEAFVRHDQDVGALVAEMLSAHSRCAWRIVAMKPSTARLCWVRRLASRMKWPGGTPTAFSNFVDAEAKRWGTLIQQKGIKAD
jgi:hypothetical protein